MDGILKVAPEQLTGTATEFSNIGNAIRNITQSMTQIATNLASVWAGDDASAYVTKFNSLQDQIDRMHGMIQEHVEDLNEMAGVYKEAKETNQSEVEGLSSDLIV